MASATVTFLGGAGTVTGSKYLVETGTSRILVDCGMFQGDKDLRERNWAEFPVDPRTISAVLVTHAHMDHTGYLPRLVRGGFRGPIWATAATAALADIVLRDSANLQEQDARDAAQGGYSKHAQPEPLYTIKDVNKTMNLFRPVEFGAGLDLGAGTSATFYRAGHILGSASIRLGLPGTAVVFSGDLGRHDHPVLLPRTVPPGAPTVLVESTYGDREHPDAGGHEDLAQAIRRTAERGGSILVPAFAVDRTEILLATLADMKTAGRIPDLPVFIDSPMGCKALDVYDSPGQRDELRPELRETDFAHLAGVREVTSVEESIRLNQPKHPSIIISSSGMATGGRVVHHLEHMLPDKRHTVVFTGYQAHGTRGQQLLAGATQIKMFGKYVPVRAQVLLDDGFSVHADGSDLIDWLAGLDPQPDTVYVVHGEEGAPALAKRVRQHLGLTAAVPHQDEKVRLN